MAQRTLREIIDMPINNGETRGAKVDALHDYMLQNNIPRTNFEINGVLDWPSQARDQKQQIHNMIEFIEANTGFEEGEVDEGKSGEENMSEDGDYRPTSPTYSPFHPPPTFHAQMQPPQQQTRQPPQQQTRQPPQQQAQLPPPPTTIAERNLSSTRQAAALSNALRSAAMQMQTATTTALPGGTDRRGIDTVRSMLLGKLTGLTAGTKPTGTQRGEDEAVGDSVWFFTRTQLENDFCTLTVRIVDYIKGYYKKHWDLVRGGTWEQLKELGRQFQKGLINGAGLPQGSQSGLSEIETISISLCDLTTIIFRTTADLDAGVQRQSIGGDSRTSRFIYYMTSNDSIFEAFGPLLRNLMDTPLMHAWPAVETAFENFINWFNTVRLILLPQTRENSDERRLLSQDLSIDTPLFADDGFPNWPVFIHDSLLYVLWLQSMNRFRSTILELAQTAHTRTQTENIEAFRYRMGVERQSVESILRLLNERQREIIGGAEILQNYITDLNAIVGDNLVQLKPGGVSKHTEISKIEGPGAGSYSDLLGSTSHSYTGSPKNKSLFKGNNNNDDEQVEYAKLKTTLKPGTTIDQTKQAQAMILAETKRRAALRSQEVARQSLEAQPRIAEATSMWDSVMTQLENPRSSRSGTNQHRNLLNFINNTTLSNLTRNARPIQWPAGINPGATLRQYLRNRFIDATVTNPSMLERARQRQGYSSGHSPLSQILKWIEDRIKVFDQSNQISARVVGGRKTRKYKRRHKKTKRHRKRGKKTRHRKRKKKRHTKNIK